MSICILQNTTNRLERFEKVLNSVVIDRLQNLIGYVPTQNELVMKTGIKQTTLSNKATRNSKWKIEEIQKLNKGYGVDILQSKSQNITKTISVDYFPDAIASCGNGTFEMSNNKIAYDVPATLFPASANNVKYSMCHAKGNSMYPRIWDGDFVICEHPEELKIINGELYIFCYDDQIYLKRLTKNINQIVVESENPDFPTQYIEKECMNDMHLIGHVVCWGRMNEKFLEKRS